MVYNSTGISCGCCSGQFMPDHSGRGHALAAQTPVDTGRPSKNNAMLASLYALESVVIRT